MAAAISLAACSGGGSTPGLAFANSGTSNTQSQQPTGTPTPVMRATASPVPKNVRNATPTPSPAPTHTPTQTPSPQPSPTYNRPEPAYAPDPFTVRLTGNEPLDANSTQEINAMYAVDGHFWMSELQIHAPGDQLGMDGESFSLAYSTDLDPAFTLHCTLYTDCPEEGQVVHIPGGLEPADGWSKGGEAHVVVLNWTEAREDGLYHLNQIVPMQGGTLNIGYGGPCYFSSYNKGGACGEASTAGAIPVGPMMLRADELVAATAAKGDLGHVLYVATCVSSGHQRWPAVSGNGTGGPQCPPMGALIVLRKTDAQIAALNVPEWDRVILRTLAHYGMMADDNNGYTVWTFGPEDDNGRTSLGLQPAWPAAIALIAQTAKQYAIDMSVSSGTYHIPLPYDTLQQSDMAVLAPQASIRFRNKR
jgi:hypothetical protein